MTRQRISAVVSDCHLSFSRCHMTICCDFCRKCEVYVKESQRITLKPLDIGKKTPVSLGERILLVIETLHYVTGCVLKPPLSSSSSAALLLDLERSCTEQPNLRPCTCPGPSQYCLTSWYKVVHVRDCICVASPKMKAQKHRGMKFCEAVSVLPTLPTESDKCQLIFVVVSEVSFETFRQL